MVHFYLGDGKGKTTAALGLALRGLGWGRKVYIAQFLKDVKFPCGEIKAIKKYKLKVTIERFQGQIHPMFLKDREIDKKRIKKSVGDALCRIEKYIERKRFDIIILDEIFNALACGFVSLTLLKKVIKKAKDLELILTGQGAPPQLFASADYISFIRKVKHPFDKGVFARGAIEY